MHPTRIFKHPDELWNAWLNYKAKRKEQAKDWPKVQYVGKDGYRVEDYPVLPLTMEGFYIYCFDNHGSVKEYFLNRDGYYDEFNTICSRVKDEIRDQQITGGMLGQFNTSITQRLNGLTEKTENKNEVTIKNFRAEFGIKKD